MVQGILIAILATMLWAPGTTMDRTFRRVFVEPVVDRLLRFSRGQVIVTVVLMSAVAAIVAILGADGAMIMQMAAPEVIAWLTAFDIATIVDGLAITATIAAGAHGTRWWRVVAGRVGRPRNRARRRRRSGAVAPPPANDDEPAPASLAA